MSEFRHALAAYKVFGWHHLTPEQRKMVLGYHLGCLLGCLLAGTVIGVAFFLLEVA